MAANKPARILEQSGVELEDLLGGERAIDVPFGERALRVVYNPQKMTARHLKNLSAGGEGEEAVYNGARSIADLVLDWDLTRKGEPWPLTVEDVAAVPFKILNRIMKALVEDQTVDPT